MAKRSLSKSASKLNLTRRQAALFQKIILAGNRMAELLADIEYRAVSPKVAIKAAAHWASLMESLGRLLL